MVSKRCSRLVLGDGAAIHCAGKHDRRNLVDDKLAETNNYFARVDFEFPC